MSHESKKRPYKNSNRHFNISNFLPENPPRLTYDKLTLSVNLQTQTYTEFLGSTDGCMFGEILELWNLSDAAFYFLLIDIVRSEMDSPALHVRMRQTLRECLVPALMLLSRQKDAPKIILTE